MGGSASSPRRKSAYPTSPVSTDSLDGSNNSKIINTIEKKIALGDGGLGKTKLLEAMFTGMSNIQCSSRGRTLMRNCFEKLNGQQDNERMSPDEFEHMCQLILDGHGDPADSGGKYNRVKFDRQLVTLLLLEREGQPDPAIVEDILLLAYAASIQPTPLITDVDKDFAKKLAAGMVHDCDSIDTLLHSWERLSLPIAHACRTYFASRLVAAAGSVDLSPPSAIPRSPASFDTPIGSFGLWILSEILPASYNPQPPPLAQNMPPFTQWQLLFDNNNDGLSFSRLETLVFDYKSPTLVLFSFNQNVFVGCIDCEWRKGVMKWGGPDCCLYQLLPRFHIVESGSGMVVCNTKDRSVPRGLLFGSKLVHIEIDDGLLEVKLYGVPSRLEWIQVIGCGAASARNAQTEYRRLTVEDARRLKDKKLHVDDWNVDTKILDWGGVQRGSLAQHYGIEKEKKGSQSSFQNVEGTIAEVPPPSSTK